MAKSFNKKKINDRLFSLFSERTRSELAALLNVSQSRLSEWKAGKQQVPWDKLAYAKELSGKSWDWMLGEDDDEPQGGMEYSPQTEEPSNTLGLDEKIALCLENATFIHQHLGEAQRYLLRGELSADAFLKLADSLAAEIESAIAARHKRLENSESVENAG